MTIFPAFQLLSFSLTLSGAGNRLTFQLRLYSRCTVSLFCGICTDLSGISVLKPKLQEVELYSILHVSLVELHISNVAGKQTQEAPTKELSGTACPLALINMCSKRGSTAGHPQRQEKEHPTSTSSSSQLAATEGGSSGRGGTSGNSAI